MACNPGARSTLTSAWPPAAAMQAAMIKGDAISAVLVLVDITPYTFGTSAFAELDGMPYPFVYVPIIKKNTPIPVTKSEVFYTMYDNQEKVMVEVYQGEEVDAKRNLQIGEFTIEGLGPAPANSEIVTTFELDKNGILHVTCRKKKTGLEKKISIDNALSRFTDDDLAKAKNKIVSLFGDEAGDDDEAADDFDATEATARHRIVQAEALIEKAERMLEAATPEDREEMVGIIEEIRDALIANDLEALDDPMSALADILFYLES